MARTRACEARKDTVRIALTRRHVKMAVCEYINDGWMPHPAASQCARIIAA
jgi:hypothetical protein